VAFRAADESAFLQDRRQSAVRIERDVAFDVALVDTGGDSDVVLTPIDPVVLNQQHLALAAPGLNAPTI
jgi:hypothetical protein